MQRRSLRLVVALLVLGGGLLAQRLGFDVSEWTGAGERTSVSAPARPGDEPGADSRVADVARLERAAAERRSGVMVEVPARVVKLLPDDTRGSRHQRFLVRVRGDADVPTLLVAHNIDLAERIDALREGDAIRIRGQYEWNEKGGVLHWTHHDPAGRRAGGWIEHAGRRIE